MKTSNALVCIRNEKGIAIIYVGLLMLLMCAFLGFAIDVGYMYMAKGQLQNAADAGALAGAGTIYPATFSSIPPPDFTNAQATAADFVKKNNAAAAKLTDADIVSIEVGYWNLSQNPTGMQPTTTERKGKCGTSGNVCFEKTAITDCAATEACLIQDVPAVKVTVQKSGLPTWFTRVLGWKYFSPAATSVAAVGYPDDAGLSPFPIALTKCAVDDFFKTYKGKVDPTDPNQTIIIWGPYGPSVPNCNTGQWTSLKLGTNNVPDIDGLMHGKASPLVNYGDIIHIDPGTKDTLYQTVDDEFIGKTVILPVVADATATNQDTPVLDFVAFKIEGACCGGCKHDPMNKCGKGNSNKQVYGNFVAYYQPPANVGLHPGGPQTNIVTPPVLVH